MIRIIFCKEESKKLKEDKNKTKRPKIPSAEVMAFIEQQEIAMRWKRGDNPLKKHWIPVYHLLFDPMREK
jgi:hypothetical protein